MDAFAVFGIQNLLSFVVFGLLAWWYVWQWLTRVDRRSAFTALTFVHALRPIGATVLVASVAGTALPRDFAEAVAYGDLATSVVAIVTLLALRGRLGIAVALVWLTNLIGTADLLNALVGGVRYDVARLGMGSFWYVVTILVPVLWIAHVLAFALLLRRDRPRPQERTVASRGERWALASGRAGGRALADGVESPACLREMVSIVPGDEAEGQLVALAAAFGVDADTTPRLRRRA